MKINKHFISIDENKCIACKMCVNDCPQANIFISEHSKAQIKSQQCMKCGHCVAICPKNAISMSGFEETPQPLTELKGISPDDLMDAIKKRRSIRQFLEKPVEEDKIAKIIEAGRYSPTGKNSQGVRYIILQQQKQEAEALAVKLFRKLLKTMTVFSNSYRDFEIDENFFFKKAPLVIVVAADNTVNGSIAASNMALMAESLGLGVLYSGFFTVAAKLSLKIRKILNVKKKELVMTLVIGYPSVIYQRTAQKEKADITYK